MIVLGCDGHIGISGQQTLVELLELGRRLTRRVREVGLDERRQRLVDGIDDVDFVASLIQHAAEELADPTAEVRGSRRPVSGTAQENCNA